MTFIYKPCQPYYNSQMDKKQQVQRFTEDILAKIRSAFDNHKRRIQKQNSEKSYPGQAKNETVQSFYSLLPNIVDQLQALRNLVKKVDKLRKERKALYEKKIVSFIEAVETIRKNRHYIKIKINDALTKLVAQTKQIITMAQKNLQGYEKQSSQFCGKAWDFKPMVESSMTQIAQLSFLWSFLPKLQSITNDSVNQIYIPVNYDQSQFKYIFNDLINVWPSPEVIQKQIRIPQIQIKDDSQLRQAHELLFGFTRSQNVQRALQIYHQQAQKKNCHPTSLNALGDMYEGGKFVKRDLNKAVRYYKKSADMNDPEGLYKIGQFLEKRLINSKEIFQGLYPNRQAQIRGGIQYYEKAAKLGHLDAMTDLGFIYQKGVKNESGSGYFIDPHPQHALKYYLKTKKYDFPRGYNNLGTLLITTPSLSEQAQGGNLLKGIKYLQKAAQLKYPKAFLNLGKCYQNGVGVSENIDKARTYYLLGAQLGDTQCKLLYVKSCLGFRIDEQKTMIKMVQLTRQILIEDSHNAQALYFMGLFLEQGIAMDKNAQSSLYYINTAARMEYPPAINKLGDYYYTGYGVKKDLQYAKMLYEKAAEKGDSKGLINLGVMMEKGIGFAEKDPRKAYQLYEQAAAMGNADAMIILSTTGANQMKPADAVTKASHIGSLQAAKILKSTHIFAPKKQKNPQTYTQTLKTLQNFYVRTSSANKRA